MPSLIRILLLLALVVIAQLQSARADAILPKPTKLGAHTYVWIGPYEGPNKANQGFRMNLGFVIGSQAVAVLDTGYTEQMAREMLTHIRALTALPVRYAVNTNSQPHRYFGNAVFQAAGAELITHPAEKTRMQAMGSQFGLGIENALGLQEGQVALPPLPESLVAERRDLDLGGVSLHIRHHGASHTPASLVVHIVEDNIVYAGDILYSGRLLAVLPASNVRGWLQTFDSLREYGNALFIPGHGEPAPLAEFESPTAAYLRLLHEHMSVSVEKGVDANDAVSTLDQSAFQGLANFDALAGRNASWAYLEAERAFFE